MASFVFVSLFDIKVRSALSAADSPVTMRDVHCLVFEEGSWLPLDGCLIEHQRILEPCVSYFSSYNSSVVLRKVISIIDP